MANGIKENGKHFEGSWTTHCFGGESFVTAGELTEAILKDIVCFLIFFSFFFCCRFLFFFFFFFYLVYHFTKIVSLAGGHDERLILICLFTLCLFTVFLSIYSMLFFLIL